MGFATDSCDCIANTRTDVANDIDGGVAEVAVGHFWFGGDGLNDRKSAKRNKHTYSQKSANKSF